MNEVNILMNFKHPSLLNFLRQYEDKQHIYLLYEFWVGDPLYKLFLSGHRMQTAQMANVLYQVVKLLKVLHQEHIYHGSITPQNIIVMRSPNNVQKITLNGFSYRESAVAGDYQWLAKRLPPKWVPPELQLEQEHYDPLKFDSYLLGCTLYYMMTYVPGMKSKETSFIRSVDNFSI
jgi:serine/threonine protein kinase